MTRFASLFLSSFAFAFLCLTREGEPSVAPEASPSPTVSVPFTDGTTVTFEGKEISGRNGGAVDAFYGIPFGEEPARWSAPVMKEWNGTETTVDASDSNFPACLQYSEPSFGTDPNSVPRVIGDNDCLKLNVWKPANATASSDLPVMVFIHGGAAVEGGISTSPDANLNDGKALYGGNLTDDTVVVTLQYRLGPLGWLGGDQLRNLSAINSTGLYGFLDQRLALQWIHENIHAFGGDPEKVFLFGESEGAGAVSAHMISEGSWPYFSSAGMQSGAFNSNQFHSMATSEANYDNALKTKNCTSVDCLLNTSDEALLLQFGMNPVWGFVVDGVVLKQNATSALASGSVKKMPVIMGTNLDEATSFGGPLISRNVTTADLETMDCQLGENLYTNVSVMDGAKGNITTSLAEAFDFSKRGVPTPVSTVNDVITGAYWEGVAIASARLFGCDTVNAAEELSAPTYVYELRAQIPIVAPMSGIHNDDGTPVAGSSGVTHGLTDLAFVFSVPPDAVTYPYWDRMPPNGFDEITENQQDTLSATMSQAWINFAKTNDPGFGWQPWTKEDPTRAVFDYNSGDDAVENEKSNDFVVQCEVLTRFCPLGGN